MPKHHPHYRISALVAAILSIGQAPAFAQTTPDAGTILRETERQPRQLPKSAPQATPKAPAPAAADTTRVQVKAFTLSGNTLLTEAELQAALQPWVGKESSFAELQQAVNALAEAYRKRGWFARPQLPAQDVSRGVVTINIIEGRLGQVRIDDGGKELRVQRSMVTNTMTARQQPGDPLNLDALERSSSILNDTPGVVVATFLTPGKAQAESDAVVKVADKPLLASTVLLDNTGSRSTGAQKISITAALDNPTGTGDQGSLNANASDGSTYVKLAYSLPAGSDGLRLGGNISGLQYKLVGPDFEALKSNGHAQTYGINTNYPLLRSGTKNVALAAAFDRKDYYNEANSVATSQKRIHTTLVAFTGDILDGLGAGGITLWGVNLTMGHADLAANPTNQATDRIGPRSEGGYHKWAANLARLQRLSDKINLWASVNAQWAGKNLDSSEKLSLGGPSSVRAYPVSEGSGDSGWQATIEGRYSLSSELQLTAFYDHGYIRRDFDASYAGALLPATAELSGAGLSLNWSKPGIFTARATVARRTGDNPLRTLATGKDSDGSLEETRLWFTAIAYF